MKRGALFLVVLFAAAGAGCTAEGATTGNFELAPQAIGWYAGEEAVFTLTLTPSMTRSSPSFTLDRDFALEELNFDEEGASFGGDYRTRNPRDVELRLVREGVEGESFVLDTENPSVDIHLRLPEDLRDSSYILELRLFKVGWVKSSEFRVDLRA